LGRRGERKRKKCDRDPTNVTASTRLSEPEEKAPRRRRSGSWKTAGLGRKGKIEIIVRERKGENWTVKKGKKNGNI